VRATGFLLVLALLLQSCTPAFVAPPVEPTLPPATALTGSPSTVDAFTLGSVASDGGAAIDPLFELPSIPTNEGTLGLTVWGAKDANGNITTVTQAEVSGLGTGTSVHVFFDAANLPVLFVDDSSGYSIAVTNENTSQPVVTLCDPNGAADTTITLSASSGAAQTGTASSGGSCATSAVVTTASSRRTADTVVETNTASFANITKLITAGSYVAGFGFAVGAILKFKQHKDNPTQIPIGTPIALIFIAAALLFLPSLVPSSGGTLFASSSLTPVDGLLPLYEPTP
jgi:intracellular multiplication protein IcmD